MIDYDRDIGSICGLGIHNGVSRTSHVEGSRFSFRNEHPGLRKVGANDCSDESSEVRLQSTLDFGSQVFEKFSYARHCHLSVRLLVRSELA